MRVVVLVLVAMATASMVSAAVPAICDPGQSADLVSVVAQLQINAFKKCILSQVSHDPMAALHRYAAANIMLAGINTPRVNIWDGQPKLYSHGPLLKWSGWNKDKANFWENNRGFVQGRETFNAINQLYGIWKAAQPGQAWASDAAVKNHAAPILVDAAVLLNSIHGLGLNGLHTARGLDVNAGTRGDAYMLAARSTIYTKLLASFSHVINQKNVKKGITSKPPFPRSGTPFDVGFYDGWTVGFRQIGVPGVFTFSTSNGMGVYMALNPVETATHGNGGAMITCPIDEGTHVLDLSGDDQASVDVQNNLSAAGIYLLPNQRNADTNSNQYNVWNWPAHVEVAFRQLRVLVIYRTKGMTANAFVNDKNAVDWTRCTVPPGTNLGFRQLFPKSHKSSKQTLAP